MIHRILIPAILIFVFTQFKTSDEKLLEFNTNWPQWRGPLGTGEALFGNPPVEWSETKNIKWKVRIPGKGHATPIIWEDKIFIQTAVETDQKIEKEESGDGEASERRGPPGTEYQAG